ncbi:amino acid adenylation domain-containing protein [Kitasatospora terrestris]|uniref:Amino acid adenylation domain-containing protein n=1 Tax=Kitasatospora terrestris TaxID=258051 RepID=A0ABP9DBV1_9ACTN
MTVLLTLPGAWEPDPVPTPGRPTEESVGFADLAERLGGPEADPVTALLVVHLKVLDLISEDEGLHTEVALPGRDGIRRLQVGPPGPTWQESVRRLADPLDAPADPLDADPPARHRQVLFTAVDAPGTGGYGLEVFVQGSTLRLRARADALTPDRLTALGRIYRLVLEAFAADPGGPVSGAYLPAHDRHAELETWGSGGTAHREPVGVDELITAQAARTPDATAVRTAAGTLSYRDLEERSNRIARHLRSLGSRPDTLIGVCLGRTLDLLPVLIGVWKSGAGYLPLDPELPAERLRLMAAAAGCEIVVTERRHLEALGPAGPGHHRVLMDEHRAAVDAHPPTAPEAPVRDHRRLAYVIYTSGSTGAPKGVMIEHRGLANYLLWTVDAYAARGTGGSAVFSSISFDLGIPNLFTPLLTGQPVHLLPEPLDLADLGDRLAEGAPYSFLKMTPGHLDLLSLDLTPAQTHRLAGIVVAAGDAFTSELAARWIDSAGTGGTVVGTEYGPTEITVGNSGEPVLEPPSGELIALGAPIPNTTMYVLTERLEPLPLGVPGEVYIGGAGVARGYLGRPGPTADRFLPDPYGAPGSRLYRTGDRGRRRPDGSLEFLGRLDHQVKIRGYRVEPGEIQAVLRRHPDVAEVVVLACGPHGRGRRLAAFVVPAPGTTADADRLRAHVAADLPDHMVPTHVLAVDRIPLTANGKVDNRTLQGLLPL